MSSRVLVNVMVNVLTTVALSAGWLLGLSAVVAAPAAEDVTMGAPSAVTAASVPELVTIENDLVRVVVATARGAIHQVELKQTHPITLRPFLGRGDQTGVGGEGADGKPALAVLGPMFVPDSADARRNGNNASNWLVHDNSEGRSWGLVAEDFGKPWTIAERTGNRLALTWQGSGFSYRLTYQLPADRLAIETRMEVTNQGAETAVITPRIYALAGLHMDFAPNEQGYYLTGVVHRGGDQGSLSKETVPSTNSKPTTINGPFDYVGVKGRFFAAWCTPGAVQVGGLTAAPAVVALGPGAGAIETVSVTPSTGWSAHIWGVTTKPHGDHQPLLRLDHAAVQVPAGSTLSATWAITATSLATADLKRLSATEQRIEKADHMYRFFYVLSGALTWVLHLIQSLVGNYGVAVVLLTLLVKALLFRLTWKQHASMFKMAKLAPKLKALQNQYGNDRQQMAMKQMELYKKEGVNPLGGCLPLLVQIPIFIALYNAFQYSADMRGTAFLWIPDLTLPDQLMGMPIAFLNNWVLSLNPLPIAYIAITIWMSFSQPMPTGGDPQQEQMMKMMRWLPVVFGVIFYNFAAGLVLYFTVNALLSTLEVRFIKARLAKQDK